MDPTQPATRSTPWGAILAGLALFGLGLWAVGKVQPITRKDKHGYNVKPKGAGYYALLYNYERGHPSRRLKGFDGPFSTRREAENAADREKDVWYPSVRKLTNDPFTLGM